jgi:ubiquinone biosynthesis protein
MFSFFANILYLLRFFVLVQIKGCNFLLREVPYVGVLFWPFEIFSVFFFKKSKGSRIRNLCISLGPAFIKLGQMLSTRPDLIGDEYAKELTLLQDRLPPFALKYVKKRLENEFSKEIKDVFEKFDEVPVAAASISQVHKAVTKEGKEVAVKILRPSIRRIFNREIGFLYLMACFVNLFGPLKRLRLKEVVKILRESTKKELDFRFEAASATQMKENMRSDDNIYIPKIYWEYCGGEVLTSEWIDGTKIHDLEALKKKKIDVVKLSENLINCYFNQAYKDGFFHADMHPGNILILDDGRISFIDFGIMGHLTYDDKIYVTRIIHGFVKRDYDEVAELHLSAGYVPKNTNIKDFSLACRSIGEPIFGVESGKISIAKMLAHLFQVTEKFGMETQPQLLLLQKTLLIVEGVAVTLNPKVNIWELGEPWLRAWALENMGLEAVFKRKFCEMKDVFEKFPKLVEDFLEYLEGKLKK